LISRVIDNLGMAKQLQDGLVDYDDGTPASAP